MNLAAILPRFLQAGFLPRQAVVGAPACKPRTIAHRSTMALANKPQQLRVLRGCIWITRDGCPEDTVLGAGEVFQSQAGARVLVHALEEAEVLIADTAPNAQNPQLAGC
jgi:hypothetical protein